MTKVFVKGGGSVNLTQNDFIDQGGEASIYCRGDTVYKVYSKPKACIPEAKIKELSVLTSPNVIKPEQLLVDDKNKPIGYTMRSVNGAHALCQLFTKAFRQREGVSDSQILNIVQRMQSTIKEIHSHNILIVDLNEFNFLVSSDFKETYFIDVDSYMTPSFPATALMESVRDRHTKGFSQLTDWFSFAVVSFQLFALIHPYKGKHPTLLTLEQRMQMCVSVLSKDVLVPGNCPSFSAVIPPAYLRWYETVFNTSQRLAPPDSLVIPTVVFVTTKPNRHTKCEAFIITDAGSFDSDVLMYACSGGSEVVTTQNNYVVDRKHYYPKAKNGSVGFAPRSNKPLVGSTDRGYLKVYDLMTQEKVYEGSAKDIMSYQNRLYLLTGNVVAEYNGIGLSPVCSVLPNAAQLFEGVVFQNLLGSAHFSFFPASSHCNQVFIKELDGYKVLSAKFESGVLMVNASKGGVYDRFVIRLSEVDWSYDIRVAQDISLTDLNFTVLENGVCVCITEEEKMEIFSAKKDSQSIKVVEDHQITGDMKLFHNGTKLMFARGEKIFNIRMK